MAIATHAVTGALDPSCLEDEALVRTFLRAQLLTGYDADTALACYRGGLSQGSRAPESDWRAWVGQRPLAVRSGRRRAVVLGLLVLLALQSVVIVYLGALGVLAALVFALLLAGYGIYLRRSSARRVAACAGYRARRGALLQARDLLRGEAEAPRRATTAAVAELAQWLDRIPADRGVPSDETVLAVVASGYALQPVEGGGWELSPMPRQLATATEAVPAVAWTSDVAPRRPGTAGTPSRRPAQRRTTSRPAARTERPSRSAVA